MGNHCQLIGTATVTAGQLTSDVVDLISGQGSMVGVEIPEFVIESWVKLKVARYKIGPYRYLLRSDLSGHWFIPKGVDDFFVFVPELSPVRFVLLVNRTEKKRLTLERRKRYNLGENHSGVT